MSEKSNGENVNSDRTSESTRRLRRPWRRPTLRKGDIKEATRGLFPLLTAMDEPIS